MTCDCRAVLADGSNALSASAKQCTECKHGLGHHIDVDPNGFVKATPCGHQGEDESGDENE